MAEVVSFAEDVTLQRTTMKMSGGMGDGTGPSIIDRSPSHDHTVDDQSTYADGRSFIEPKKVVMVKDAVFVKMNMNQGGQVISDERVLGCHPYPG